MKFLTSTNRLKGYVYVTSFVLSIGLGANAFATHKDHRPHRGGEVGRGDDGSGAYRKYFGYCSDAISILERAQSKAYRQNGNTGGERRILVQGLTEALAQIPDGQPLTKSALARGLVLNQQFQNGCKNIEDPSVKEDCKDREVRTAVFFLGQWYRYVKETVFPLDADYYINYYDYRRGYARYDSDSCDNDGEYADSDRDGGGEGDFSDDGAGDGERHENRGHRRHHRNRGSYECWRDDWGSDFYVEYKSAAQSLLSFYTGSNNGMPKALAMNTYELDVASQLFTWAAHDLNLEIFNREFKCIAENLAADAKEIADYNAGVDVTSFRNSDQATRYAEHRSERYASVLAADDVCEEWRRH